MVSAEFSQSKRGRAREAGGGESSGRVFRGPYARGRDDGKVGVRVQTHDSHRRTRSARYDVTLATRTTAVPITSRCTTAKTVNATMAPGNVTLNLDRMAMA